MEIYLITPENAPRRLRRQGRELRTKLGVGDVFAPNCGRIEIDRIRSVDIVAPYSKPKRILSFFGVGVSVGLACAGLAEQIPGLPLFALLALTFSVLGFIIPNGTGSTYVLARVSEGSYSHMLAFRREDVEAVKSMIPAARWGDDISTISKASLLPQERHQLRLMQIGIVLIVTAVGMFTLLLMQEQSGIAGIVSPENTLLDRSSQILFLVGEALAFLLIIACWVRMVAIARDERKIQSGKGDAEDPQNRGNAGPAGPL